MSGPLDPADQDCTAFHGHLLEVAVRAARAGATELRHYFRQADLEIRRKGANDFVTQADHASEERILAEILGEFPDHYVLAEESGSTAGSQERRPAAGAVEWIIDPLDGTTNFLQGLPVFCVSIGARQGDELVAGVVYDPMGENLFTACAGGGAYWNGRPIHASARPGLAGAFLATGYPFRASEVLDVYLRVFRDVFRRSRGIRRCGAAALDLAYTAAGVFDGFFEFRLSPWDLAAGAIILRQAGGVVTNLDGGADIFAGGNVIGGGVGVQRELREAVNAHVDERGIEALLSGGV
jgi:myo-inositol-1(or 4)-monophosphatase